MFLLNYQHDQNHQNHQNHQNLYLHCHILSSSCMGWNVLSAAAPGLHHPALPSTLSHLQQDMPGVGWEWVVGCRGVVHGSFLSLGLDLGAVGGISVDVEPTYGDWRLLSEPAQRSRRTDGGDEARIQLHLQLVMRPISLQDRRDRGFYPAGVLMDMWRPCNCMKSLSQCWKNTPTITSNCHTNCKK